MTVSALTVRTATRADIPAIDLLLSLSYPQLLKADYPPSVLVTAIPLISRAQPALVTSGTYYVAEDGAGRILGAGGWTRRNPATGQSAADQGNIRHFGTDPGATRRGVGRAILARCLGDAKAADIKVMTCYATRTAVPFYAASGFVSRSDVEIELRAGVRFPAVLMDREVTATDQPNRR